LGLGPDWASHPVLVREDDWAIAAGRSAAGWRARDAARLGRWTTTHGGLPRRPRSDL